MRKKKTKIFRVLICAIGVMLLAGCGEVQNSASDEPSTDYSANSAEVSIDNSVTDEAAISETEQTSTEQSPEITTDGEESVTMKMNVQVGNNTFTATLEKNKAVDAFVEMMRDKPVTIQMSDYSGFEKVGSLGTSLPTVNSQTTTQAGDIVLYQGNQIVIFYGSNSWSYTRLGKIDDLTGWEKALGDGNVTVTFSLAE